MSKQPLIGRVLDISILQAAKALDSMRMTPQQEKETVMYTRLPAIARIVRTLFVNEQRGVLSWETVVEKVRFSYNRNLGKGKFCNVFFK